MWLDCDIMKRKKKSYITLYVHLSHNINIHCNIIHFVENKWKYWSAPGPPSSLIQHWLNRFPLFCLLRELMFSSEVMHCHESPCTYTVKLLKSCPFEIKTAPHTMLVWLKKADSDTDICCWGLPRNQKAWSQQEIKTCRQPQIDGCDHESNLDL